MEDRVIVTVKPDQKPRKKRITKRQREYQDTIKMLHSKLSNQSSITIDF